MKAKLVSAAPAISAVVHPSTVNSVGQVIIGSVVSVIVKTCSSVTELSQLSVTVNVLVTVNGSVASQNTPDNTSIYSISNTQSSVIAPPSSINSASVITVAAIVKGKSVSEPLFKSPELQPSTVLSAGIVVTIGATVSSIDIILDPSVMLPHASVITYPLTT